MSETVAPGEALVATIVPSVLVTVAKVTEAFNVSTASAWVVLVAVCVFFAILAVGSMDKYGCLPSIIKGVCLLNKRDEEAKTTDYFLSARDSAGFLSIALSFFASGMGAWVVYGSTEMGATPTLSWLGVIGYSGAAGFPAIVICFLGPYIKETSSKNAFSTSDFARERYGRIMQVSVAIISAFYMFVYMVAELTSISNIFGLLTGNADGKWFGIGVTIVIGVVTLLYTSFAGLPASIVTDRFQGLIMGLLVIILTIAICAYDENQVTAEEFGASSNLTVEGLMALITLAIAILCAELFNQATWQRVWAAESVPAMRKGFALGSFFIFLLMMFFGIIAMIAYSNDPAAYDSYDKWAYLAFFDLLLPLGNGWHIIVLILVTALAASSLDSLQNGMNSIFYRDALRKGYDAHLTAFALVVAINVPAIFMASKKLPVIGLFLVADLVCATAVLPTFLGLQETDKLNGLLPAPTELGAFFGILSGMATVLINGAINGQTGFQYFWLRNDAICSLCGAETMISFIVTPLIAGIFTYIFTHVDLALRKERARQPFFDLAFDHDDENKDDVDAKKLEVDDEKLEVDDEKPTPAEDKEVAA